MAKSRPKKTPKATKPEDNVVDILPTERGNVFHQPIPEVERTCNCHFIQCSVCNW